MSLICKKGTNLVRSMFPRHFACLVLSCLLLVPAVKGLVLVVVNVVIVFFGKHPRPWHHLACQAQVLLSLVPNLVPVFVLAVALITTNGNEPWKIAFKLSNSSQEWHRKCDPGLAFAASVHGIATKRGLNPLHKNRFWKRKRISCFHPVPNAPPKLFHY